MQLRQLVVDAYFDGCRHHRDGPYTVTLKEGIIDAIGGAETMADGVIPARARFLMPGLVEAHCHLFLDGGELDPVKRAAYLEAPHDEMVALGRRSLACSRAAGVTLIRDAGDIHGVNLQLRDELDQTASGRPGLLCAGWAIRNARRYGSFLARALTEQTNLEQMVAELATEADQIKILMTGIIDFEAGEVKGAPQFTHEQARRIVQAAKALGRRTFAHCSGAAGIDVALAAGIDSIEHGFFVTREQLQIMADKSVTWVPTFSPVYFQWSRPEIAGWNANTVGTLARILDQHRQQLDYAYTIGVPVLVGSDAGSMGVMHGRACIDEIILMAGAGVDLCKLLQSATVLPRTIWGCEPVDIAVGRRADLLLFERSPFEDLSALYQPAAVVQGDVFSPLEFAVA